MRCSLECARSRAALIFLRRGRVGGAALAAHGADADAGAFLDGVVRRNLEERGRRLGALDVCQPVSRLAEARVAVRRHQDDLEFGRVPALADDLDWQFVALLARGDGDGRARALRLDALDGARLKLLGLRLVLRRLHVELHLRPARRRGRGEDEAALDRLLQRALILPRGGRGRRRQRLPRRLLVAHDAPLKARQLARGLVARVEDVVDAGDGVVDEGGLRRVARGRVGADGAERLVAARAPLRVAIDLRRRLVHDAVAVGERLHALGDGLRRVGRALDDLAVEAQLGGDEDEVILLDLDARRRRFALLRDDDFGLARRGPALLRVLCAHPEGTAQQSERDCEDHPLLRHDSISFPSFQTFDCPYHTYTNPIPARGQRTKRIARASPSSPSSTSALTRPPAASALTGSPNDANAERGSSMRTRRPPSAWVKRPPCISGMKSVAISSVLAPSIMPTPLRAPRVTSAL